MYLLAWLAACNPPIEETDGDTDVQACSFQLAPSADDQALIQTALIDVPANGLVCLDAGTFTLTGELSLVTDGVTIRGAGREATILDWQPGSTGANGITITGDRTTVEGLTVRNTPGDGIRATDVQYVTFRDVTVWWDADSSLDNGAYGLYPVGSSGVRIERCLVKGARDAGIYVGQSNTILVADSEAHGNVAGIEIENSTDAEVVRNHSHDNTAGILVFNLPGLPVQDGKRAKVHDNVVEDNNLPNFAEPGSVVAGVPRGSGLFVIASDGNEFHDNTVTNHQTVGHITLSYQRSVFGDYDDPAFDEYPEGNWVHDNVFSNNGYDPQGQIADVIPPRPVPDVVWDGCFDDTKDNSDGALTNCISGNLDAATGDGAATYFDVKFCDLLVGQNGDAAPVTCEHTPLAAQDP